MTVYKSRSPSKYKSQKYIKSKKIAIDRRRSSVVSQRRLVTCLGQPSILDDDDRDGTARVDCTEGEPN